MKIGILGHGFIEWGGGLDFLRMMAESLVASDPATELHLLLPTRGPRLFAFRQMMRMRRGWSRLQGRPVAAAKVPDRRIVEDFAQSLSVPVHVHHTDMGSAAVESVSRRLGLHALLPSVQPLKLSASLPWLGYIADFQHVHLPQFFSAEEIAARNRNFADMLERSTTVVVNSRQCAEDIAAYLPGRRATVFALPFCAAPNPVWLQEERSVPAQRYDVGPRYFLISNQFWQHKDHLCVYRALAIVVRRYPDVQLVCTGETHDFRNPDHFPMLTREAEQLGISDRLRVLGLIPKGDQIALMRASIALIQPTLFEGGPGGGAVYDAVSLGVPALISDIPVNLEIEEPDTWYFKASDPEDLARCMIERLEHAAPRTADRETLLARGRQRRRLCGDALFAAIEHASHARS